MLVETCAGRLFVEDVGRGPEVLLWHSLLCDGGMWREQVRALSGRYRFLNIDGPGHGRSERLRHPFTLDDCVDAAARVLDAAGLERAAFCGLSWGGMVGMRLAARRPDRVSALALLDTSARTERALKKLAYRPMTALTSVIGPTRMLLPVLQRIFFARATRRARPDVVDGCLDGVTRMDKEALGHAVDAVIYRRVDCTAELARIRSPTLVLVGEQDVATPPSEAAHVAAAISGAELARIPEAGHLSVLDQPDRVTAHLGAFLDRWYSAGR